MKIIELE